MERGDFWKWIAYGCLGIVALGLTVEAVWKNHPETFKYFSSVFSEPAWSYVPIILVALGSIILAVRYIATLIGPEESARSSGPASSVPERPKSTEKAVARAFVEVTPEQLLELQANQTVLQAAKLTGPYIGKWMKLVRPVHHVEGPKPEACVLLKSTDTERPTAVLWFDEDDLTWLFWTKRCERIAWKGAGHAEEEV